MPILGFDDDAGAPNLEHVRVVVTAAQVATMFTTPVVLVPAKSNHTNIPVRIHIRKEAGTAWTMGGSGTLGIRPAGQVSFNWYNIFDQSTTNAFFGAAENVWIGGGEGGGLGVIATVHSTNGTNIEMSFGSANPSSAGTGSLICNVWYRSYKTFGYN